jgi:hypothetical protein
MSMIMRVARGSARDLERLTKSADDGSLPPEFASMLDRQRAAFAKLTPEGRAQLEAALRGNPQLGALAPDLIERLRSGLTPTSLGGRTSGGAVAGPPPDAPAPPVTIDLHKSWHVLHFLFTGQAGGGGTAPSNFLLEGGREVGEDMGYGPARLLDPAATEAVAHFTASLTVETLTQRIDAPRMAALGIYCASDGSNATASELAEDVANYFPLLQSHVQAAAQAAQSTLVWLS